MPSFFSVVDEAHSLGAMGKLGKGVTTGRSDVIVGTFTKAFGFFWSIFAYAIFS